MEEYIGIYDPDSSYAHALCTALGKCSNVTMEIVEFTRPESIEFFALKKNLCILLVAEGYEVPEAVKENIQVIIGMREERDGDEEKIFKYQSVDNISSLVMHAASRVRRDEVLEGTTARIYMVYSPVGRCLKSTLSLVMAGVLSQSGSTLFITFEEYSVIDEVLHSNGQEASLSDAIYYYIQGNLSGMERELVQTFHGIDFLSGVRDPADIRNLSGSDLMGFIRALADCKRYRNIVIDVANTPQDIYRVLGMAYRIYMPERDDFMSKGRTARFMERVRGEDAALLENIREVHPPYQHLGRDESAAGYYDRLFRGEMVDYVRGLL
ncbi:MAG: hypothetical protein K6F92_06750 [Lachnospiraceae bacterium]|nr:hypothetical protein [Lachnospiraceae bacterium]